MSLQRITNGDVARAVRDLYLSTGESQTVDQIATHLDCSVSTVRARIKECNGGLPGCDRISGEWVPTRGALRLLVLDQQARLKIAQTVKPTFHGGPTL